ncbi:luciferase-like monooxygenase family protein [Mycobacteroides abscessus]|uniref:LLM class flavin-dependent oxidoreductase n=1 Tax=Mycobacteroides abscessus TaxID=36809 RepID=UPI000452B0E1|nr:LLM class flavin-dependent oxidoreductase [Mycobacteroides abscessus]EUA66081.1 luciferase-like monooxygenase family protein [Mycobacteroides abscessus]
MIDPLLSATERIRIVTAIVNIWSAPAQQARAVMANGIQQAHPGRFILGIGAGHPEIDSGVAYKPVQRAGRIPRRAGPGRCPSGGARGLGRTRGEVAAELARSVRAAWHTPTSRRLRIPVGRVELLGPDASIVPEQKVVLTTDADEARTLGRQALDLYLA